MNSRTKKSCNYLREKFGNDETLIIILSRYEYLFYEADTNDTDIVLDAATVAFKLLKLSTVDVSKSD